MAVRTNLEMECPGLADGVIRGLRGQETAKNAPSLQTSTPTVLILRCWFSSQKGGHGG